jgi:hypothetical protein
MKTVTLGVVKNGVIVPNIPLPEGARVGIEAYGLPLDVPSDLQEEIAAVQRASAPSLELVERLTQEMENDQQG